MTRQLHTFLRVHLVALVLAAGGGCTFLPRTESPWAAGNKHFRHGDYAAAESALVAVTPDDPFYQPALQLRARVALALGDKERALALMKQAERVDPERFAKPKNLFYAQIYSAYLEQYALDAPERARAIVGGDGIAVIFDARGGLQAFDVASVRPLWATSLGGGRLERGGGNPSWAAGSVIAVKGHVSGVELVAFDGRSGVPRWSVPLGRQQHEIVPASDGTRVYVARAHHDRNRVTWKLEAVELATGELRWSLPLDGRGGRITIAEGRVFTRTQRGTIYAVDADRGVVAWTASVPGEFAAEDRLAAGGGLVYHAGRDGTVIALDATTPAFDRPLDRIRWRGRTSEGGRELVWPVVIGDLLVVPHRRSVDGFDAATGAVRWRTALAFTTVQTSRLPITSRADGDQAVIGWADRVAAIGRDGVVRWIYTGSGSAMPLVAGDVVVVGGKTTGAIAVRARPPIAY